MNFAFIFNTSPAASAYWLYMFQLILYSIACSSYPAFLYRVLLLIMEPPNQGLLVTKWKIPFRQFYVCHRDLDNLNGIDSQFHPHVLSQKLLRTQHKKQRVPRVRPRKCLLCQNTRVHTLNCGFILRML